MTHCPPKTRYRLYLIHMDRVLLGTEVPLLRGVWCQALKGWANWTRRHRAHLIERGKVDAPKDGNKVGLTRSSVEVHMRP